MSLSPRALADRVEALRPGSFRVACMPDFFLDHFVVLPAWSEVLPRMQAVHDQGGGNIPGLPQHVQSGGNAANTALALARLGVNVSLVCRTSPFGAAYLRESLGAAGVDLSHVRSDGALAMTMALEFGEERRNVMLNDSGSLREFGPDQLGDAEWRLVEEADLVAVTNWTQNLRGSELARAVCERAREAGTFTFLDAGDPSARSEDIPGFLKEVFRNAHVDAIGVNENEVRHFRRGLGERVEAEDDPVAEARALAQSRPGRLDLHTSKRTASWENGDAERVVETFRVTPKRATGAGDSWNAGNLLGYLAGLETEERLMLANAVASLYVSGEEGRHPGVGEVASFLRARTGSVTPS